ncbi:MAG: hypothetical protein IPH57_04310 [Saprospiraceae bacterium]|nr:hypothetical protein [Saprospiraceae bacterium]
MLTIIAVQIISISSCNLEIAGDQLDFSEISIETLENRIGKLTAEDVKNAAVKYFDEQNMIEVVMYPEGFKR